MIKPTLPQVLLLALCLAAPIVAQIFAPGIVPAVLGFVGTIVAALFVSGRKDPPDPPAYEVAPVEGVN